ncbi:MAG: hypothetical protein ACTHJT_17300 [Cytophaga sp.]|uniref:hypothetical protein n=1 Tax=Cytophaga sp. TaxID=29535 RepID=UPI003F814E68
MLRLVLLKTESFSYAYMVLFDLVLKKSDPELLVFLTDKLKKADLESMWFNEELMERIAKISGREDLKKVLKKIDNVDYDDKRYEEKVIKYSKEFIVLL